MTTSVLNDTESVIQAALRVGRYAEAATVAVREYGPDVCGFLISMADDEVDGREAYSQCCEDVWRGIREFRGDSTFKTWMYRLACHAFHRSRRDPYRRRKRPLPEGAGGDWEAAVYSSTLSYLRTDVRNGVARLRKRLDPDDQMVLILRVDRAMSWNDLAAVFLGEDASPEALRTQAAALRKRFERTKVRIRELAEQEGLVPPKGKGGR